MNCFFSLSLTKECPQLGQLSAEELTFLLHDLQLICVDILLDSNLLLELMRLNSLSILYCILITLKDIF